MPTINSILECGREDWDDAKIDGLASKLSDDGVRLDRDFSVEKIKLVISTAHVDDRYKDFKLLLALILQDVEGSPTKRARTGDSSLRYLREVLGPALREIPPFSQLKDILHAPLSQPLVVMDQTYEALLQLPGGEQAANLLRPLHEVPSAYDLAFRVAAMLRSELRNVEGESTNIRAVDTVFEQLFELAKMAQMFAYTCERNVSDSLSLTTGLRYRPDLMLWIRAALLFKGEEKASASGITAAEDELLSKLTSVWDTRVYGPCPYMLCYAVGGYLLRIYAIQAGHRVELLNVDMRDLAGKLEALTAVMNIIRVLEVIDKHLPRITWGYGLSHIKRDENGVAMVSRVTNEQGHVHKELFDFVKHNKKYAPPRIPPLQHLQQVYIAAAGCQNLVHATKAPWMVGKTYHVKLTPVGVAYDASGPRDEVELSELKAIIAGVLKGLQGLHTKGFVHRDVRWPNVIKDFGPRPPVYVLIDLELASRVGVDCTAQPYPLPHWLYSGDTRSVLEQNGTYSIVSDLKMVGKELLGKVQGQGQLEEGGRDLKEKLEAGMYRTAAEALLHPWLQTI